MVNTLLNSHPLGNLGNVSSIGNWADAVDQESQLNDAAHKRTEITKNGIKTVIDIVDDKDSGKCRVVTTYKVVTKKVPRAVAERKKWKKFGASANDGPGPQVNTTYVAEEVQMIFTRNRAGEQQEQENDDKKNDPMKGYASKGHCRICKADDHWSVNCPYKEMYQVNEEESNNADVKSGLKQASGAPGAAGRYVNPFARGDRVTTGLERRSDDFTCRVTNLPEDSETLEEDLRSMFGSVGRIERFYLARDKMTTKPKGFAFITFTNRPDAEMAIERFNGSKMSHLILKVEWTKPATN